MDSKVIGISTSLVSAPLSVSPIQNGMPRIPGQTLGGHFGTSRRKKTGEELSVGEENRDKTGHCAKKPNMRVHATFFSLSFARRKGH